jgi:hypothetical protein
MLSQKNRGNAGKISQKKDEFPQFYLLFDVMGIDDFVQLKFQEGSNRNGKEHSK